MTLPTLPGPLRRLVPAAATALLVTLGLFLPLSPSGSPAVSTAALQEHIRFLAGDSLAGRRPGTPGIRLAEEYIAGRFRAAGLAPPPGHTDFFLPFTLYQNGYDARACRLTLLKGETLLGREIDVDFTPLPFSGGGAAAGNVVFGGYGISAPAYGWDDYAGLDVKGKIVLVFRHEPPALAEAVTGSDQRYSRFAFFTEKTENAARHGAAAVLFVTDPAYRNGHRDEKPDRTFFRLHPSPDAPDSAVHFNDRNFKQAAIPALQVSDFTGDWMLNASGYPASRLQEQLDAGISPAQRPLEDLRAFLSIDLIRPPRPVKARDIAAFLPGRDARLRDEWIVVGAHHDHLGSFRGPGDAIFNGADDNASGTSGVLELARVLAGRPGGLRHSLLFLTFSAEEEGLLGSAALFDRQLLPRENMKVMCNLDMVGRNPHQVLQVGFRSQEDGPPAAVRAFFESHDPPSRFFDARDDRALSDDYEFAQAGIDSYFFFSGLHEDYHGVDDEYDRIDYTALSARIRLAEEFILFLDGE